MSPDRIRPGSARGARAVPSEAVTPASPATEETRASGGTAPAGSDPGRTVTYPAGPYPTGPDPTGPDRADADTGDVSAGDVGSVDAGSVDAGSVGTGSAEADAAEAPARRGGPAVVAGAVHHGFFRRLYFGESNLDFVGRRRLWFTLSTILILAGVISLATRGLNLDIEFVGGTSWTVQSPTVTVSEAKSALAPFNLSGSTITVLGGTGTSARSLEVQAKIPKGQTPAETHAQLVKVEDALAHLAHTSPQQVSIESVGPSWGGQVTTKAIQALVVFFVLVALYISVFFEWRMALGAIIAVLHDILVTVGIYSLTGFDVTPDTVVAILTILGYSLYDTIVVFDRVRDNLKGVGASGRLSISDVVNLSMNQTLARSINTSLVAIMPIFAVLILGAEILGATTLQYFGWALLIGLTSGAYSSIFVASPIVAMLKEREPRWRRIRERLALRNEHLVLSPAALAAGLLGGDGASAGLQRNRTARASAARRASEARAIGGGQGDGVETGSPGEAAATSTGTPARVASGSGARRSGAGRPPAGRPSGGARRKGGRR